MNTHDQTPSWKKNNKSVDKDTAVDGKYKTNAQKQADLRDKVAGDKNLQRGVTITNSSGHRWIL